MSDYIKREDAVETARLHRVNGYHLTINIADEIEKLPSADVAPVRHGHWIEEQDRIVCSECGARFKDEIIYMQENKPGAPHRCLECGAIMDKEENDGTDDGDC